MPEYSSTTLTPTNETKVPAMQNNNSGNFQLDALKAYILAEKAQANGLASLDAAGKLVSSQIPDNLDDVLVYGSYALLPATGVEGKIYITADTNSMYRWDASLETPDYVMLFVDLEEYATKAELQAETNQRKASDSRLEARLENLEQKAGDYTTVQYRGTNAVPTGKAKYGLVEKIVGKSRAWNQLFDIADGTKSLAGVSLTILNGKFSASGTPSGAYEELVKNHIPIINGHRYLLIQPSIFTVNWELYPGVFSTSTSFGSTSRMLDAISSGDIGLYIRGYSSVDISIDGYFVFRDLTTIFPEGVPLTIAECVQKCPDLLKYDAYNTSLVDETLSGAKSVGVNLMNLGRTQGTISGNQLPRTFSESEYYVGLSATNYVNSSKVTGVSVTDDSVIATSSEGYGVAFPVRCKPSTEYSFKYTMSTYSGISIMYFDANGNYLTYELVADSDSSKTFISPTNAYWLVVLFRSTTSGQQLIATNVIVNLGSVKSFVPYKTDTLSLPTPFPGRSAGTEADELDVESGVAIRRINRIPDLSTMNWASIDSSSSYSYIFINDRKSGVVPFVANFPSTIKEGQMNANNLGFVIYFNAGTFSNVDQLKSALSGCSLNYPLATPTTESIDPIPYNFLEVEGGGTVETIQTQTPVIDNCLDVGYLAV